MIGVFYILVVTGIVVMGLNIAFATVAFTIPEHLNPIVTLVVFIGLSAISLFFIYVGFNLNIFLPVLF